MIFVQFYSNEIDFHFFYEGEQMAGFVGAIGAKWCFVHPTDKTAAGVCLDPRHRGRRSAPGSERRIRFNSWGARSAGLRRCGEIPAIQQFRRLPVGHLTY